MSIAFFSAWRLPGDSANVRVASKMSIYCDSLRGDVKTETHVLQLENHRITVRVEDRRPDDLPRVEVMTDLKIDYNDSRLIPWMRKVLRPYAPHTIAGILR
jgi:hypothetical protein